MRGTALPVSEAVDFVLQACSAMAVAHAAGIIHRDLKPANLFLTRRPDGSALLKVLDFGISKMSIVDAPAGLTHSHAIMGSPHYNVARAGAERAPGRRSHRRLVTGRHPVRAAHRLEPVSPATRWAKC